MAWQLVAEAMDHAPPGLTVAERFVLVVIAEYVGRDPNLPPRECECSTADLARRTGLTVNGVKDALRRLAGHGLDVRVPLGAGKDGRPVYTYRGRVPRYRLPKFVVPEGIAAPTPSAMDSPTEGVAVPTPSDRKGWASHPEGVGVTAGRGGPAHPPTGIAGGPVAAAAGSEGVTTPTPSAADSPAATVAERLGIDRAAAGRIVAEVERRRAPVRNLAGLLRSIPDDDLRSFLAASPAPPSTSSTLAPPCGQCEARPGDLPSARMVEDSAGRPSPCPRCHPKALAHAT